MVGNVFKKKAANLRPNLDLLDDAWFRLAIFAATAAAVTGTTLQIGVDASSKEENSCTNNENNE